MSDPIRPSSTRVKIARAVIIAVGIGLWFLSQSLISVRTPPPGKIDDGMHRLLEAQHAYFVAHTSAANALMIVSTAFIDGLALYVLFRALWGPTIRPLIGLGMLFMLRQLCQVLVSLPAPEGMIWHYPGVPAILVTYGVATDLFFSGHTSVAVFGSLEIGRRGRFWLVVGCLITAFEVWTVLTLRAHYTMDVYAAAMTALVAAYVAEQIAPKCDALIERCVGGATAVSGTRPDR